MAYRAFRCTITRFVVLYKELAVKNLVNHVTALVLAVLAFAALLILLVFLFKQGLPEVDGVVYVETSDGQRVALEEDDILVHVVFERSSGVAEAKKAYYRVHALETGGGRHWDGVQFVQGNDTVFALISEEHLRELRAGWDEVYVYKPSQAGYDEAKTHFSETAMIQK